MEHLWRSLKMAVHRCFPSNLIELERIYHKEWDTQPKSRCAKLVETYPRTLEAVITAKGGFTKHWMKHEEQLPKNYSHHKCNFLMYFLNLGCTRGILLEGGGEIQEGGVRYSLKVQYASKFAETFCRSVSGRQIILPLTNQNSEQTWMLVMREPQGVQSWQNRVVLVFKEQLKFVCTVGESP